jgi:hypothetical protein
LPVNNRRPRFLLAVFGFVIAGEKVKTHHKMKKNFLLTMFLLLAGFQIWAQQARVDTVAVSILDRMSAMIGELGSCSVTVKSNYDVVSRELGLVKHSDEQQLFLQGPDKLLVKSEGDKGSRDLYYNGKTLTYYSLDKNQFGQITLSAPIMDMIDTVNKSYGIEFPAADVFYPGFVDDILADSKNLRFLGIARVEGKECFHVAGVAKDKTYQFWIADDAYSLPMKMVIVYTGKDMNPQYEAVLTDWKINPSFPAAIFEFNPPPRAHKVKMLPVTAKK